MNRAIMTGVTGFIGSWLALELMNDNVEVLGIVRHKEDILPSILNNSHFSFVECNYEKMDELTLENKGFNVFFHLGWGGVSAEDKNNLEMQLNNIQCSIKAIKLAKKINCGTFVAAGTVAEYAFSEDVLDVNNKQTPNDLYGAAKVSTHYFLDIISRQLSQNFIWVILPSTFGERRTDNNILTYTIKKLLKNEKPMYGNLMQMWDFLYVAEVARALKLVGEYGIPGKTYGIGSGVYRPLEYYIKKIRDIIDPKAELGIGEKKEMDSKSFSACVNIMDLVKDTGFYPEVSFEDGINKTIEWYRKEMT